MPRHQVFERREVRTVSCTSSVDGTACGMHQAFPLMSASGEVGSVLVLFHKREDKPEIPKAPSSPNDGRLRPERTDSRLGDLIGASPAMHQLFDMIPTNKDLTDLVKAKAFRQDLYYRLAVLPIRLPPLHERRGDIPRLVSQFIVDSCRRHRQVLRHVSDEAMRALAAAPWPGNVRELQHYIERAVVTTSGTELACTDLVAVGSHAEDADLRTVVGGAARQAERARILQAPSRSPEIE